MIRKDISTFVKSIPAPITLVAATKYMGVTDLLVLLSNGVNNFGENRVDSFLEKYEALKDEDITWHFIGHLQRNKAEKVIDKIKYLHSLDSLSLARLINKKRDVPLSCFIEVSINLEENKNGVPYYELESFIKECLPLDNIKIEGLMMMAKANSSPTSLMEQFSSLRRLKEDMEKKMNIRLPYLSMGMSDDYLFAIKEGATHIRLGRILLEK